MINIKNKSILLFSMALLAVFELFSQDAIDRYFGSYADDPDATTITISSKMFSLFAEIEPDDPDSKEALDAMSDLTGIRIITKDGLSSKQSYSKVVDKVGKEYELLMSIDENDEKVRFFVREEKEKIAELFMVVEGKDMLFLMSILGDIDLNKISKMSKSMNVGGMNYLENLDEKEGN